MMKTKDIEKKLKITVITQGNLGELLKALAILDIKFQIIFQEGFIMLVVILTL